MPFSIGSGAKILPLEKGRKSPGIRPAKLRQGPYHCDLHVDWRSLLRLASEVCTCHSRNYNNNRNNNSNSSSPLSLHKILPMPENNIWTSIER